MKIVKKCKDVVTTKCSVEPDKYCCRKMKHAMSYDNHNMWSFHELKLVAPTKIGEFYDNRPDEYQTFNYCPFCGERIE